MDYNHLYNTSYEAYFSLIEKLYKKKYSNYKDEGYTFYFTYNELHKEHWNYIKLLDEHFRSKTDLIQFSNENFYDGQLKLIRSNPISDSISSIEIIETNGSRSSAGSNDIEADDIIKKIL